MGVRPRIAALALAAALGVLGCSTAKRQSGGDVTVDDGCSSGRLELRLVLEADEVGAGAPTPTRIALVNCGEAAAVVNARLAMGYADSLDREVYLELERDGAAYRGWTSWMLDYRRKPLDANALRELAPREQVGSEIDLQEWYRLEPGTYRVRAVYAPEARDAAPALEPGPVASDWVSLRVR